MIKKFGSILGVVSILVLIVFVSGCTNSGSDSIKHYENSNFSFDYPSDWNITDNYTNFEVGWTKTGDIYGGIAVVPLDSGETFNSYVKEDSSDRYNANILNLNNTTIKVDNYSGVSYSFIDSQGAYYIVYLNGGKVVYQIEVKDYNAHMDAELNTSEGYKGFNKILNSLHIKT